MNRQSVTLRAHDSINLTTGVVTRSDRCHFCDEPCHLGLCAPVATANPTVNEAMTVRIRNRNAATSSNRPDVLRHRYGTANITYAVEIGLRANDPDALRVAITLAACEWCGEMDHSGDDCPC